MDIYQKICHDSSLHPRNIIWKLPEEPIAGVVVKRSVLDSIGCNNKTMLRSVCERSGGTIKVDKEMTWDGNVEESEGAMAALFCEDMFHNISTADSDSISDSYERTEFGNDRPGDVSRELKAKIREAGKEGFPGEKVNDLKEVIQKHQLLIEIRLGTEGSADIAPIKIKLDPAMKPVRLKVHRYPTEQQSFLDAYLSQLVSLIYLHPDPNRQASGSPPDCKGIN